MTSGNIAQVFCPDPRVPALDVRADEDDVRTEEFEGSSGAEVWLRRIVPPGTATAAPHAVAWRASSSKRYVINVNVNVNFTLAAFGSAVGFDDLKVGKMMLHDLCDVRMTQ